MIFQEDLLNLRKYGKVKINIIKEIIVIGVFLWWGKWRKKGVLMIEIEVI